ncbi:3-hydroxyisobutyrate dehydrogenase [Roseibium suaedae]|uniref:L-threonate dehydrogenase n=1 Tax=Roseibium suaedae TaxID=735517 RepID=A0A1M6YTT6_9HYPH|nr:3-hydroxyisobutyrate dehydrogenase [Roseibium suaedae]
MNKNIGVIGLGSMGFGMATSLVRAGHRVWGADVNAERVEALALKGGNPAPLPEAAHDLDILVVVVLNADQTREVLFGKTGIAGQLKPGTVVISCATVAPEFAREMAELCAAKGLHYLDAPISGGSVKAAEGRLSIMASGTPEAFSTAQPALNAMAETVFELGETPGSGSAMKAVNQLLAGVHIATMAEAITFGMTQGITPEQILDVIPKCAGTSWMFENRAPHIVAGDYTPHSSVNIWPKDLGIVLDIARSARFSAPVTAAALQQFLAAAGSGLGHEDDAAVAKVYARNAGISLPDPSSAQTRERE